MITTIWVYSSDVRDAWQAQVTELKQQLAEKTQKLTQELADTKKELATTKKAFTQKLAENKKEFTTKLDQVLAALKSASISV